MPHYYQLGSIPHKRHTQFRKPDGTLYSEQLFSTEGFSDDYALLYHCHPPTQIIRTEPQQDVSPQIAEEKMLQHRSFEGFKVPRIDDYLQSRIPVLVNGDCHIVLAAPRQSTTEYFYKNTDGDEMIFVHEGSGVVKTQYGQLPFGYGDYIVLPRGTIYQITPFASDKALRPDGQRWIFQPTGLCEPIAVRIMEDEAWIEVRFDPLTASIEDESYYIP